MGYNYDAAMQIDVFTMCSEVGYVVINTTQLALVLALWASRSTQ